MQMKQILTIMVPVYYEVTFGNHERTVGADE